MLFKTLESLHDFAQKARNEGKTIAWTNGCFDILHPGHVETFRFARERADYLIVGINADDSPYFRTKPGRPVNSEAFRTAMLESIRFVDGVYAFSEETPILPIEALVPDLLVKWGDYEVRDIVGYDVVTKNGGAVVTVPTVGGFSTTGVIKKILATYGKNE